MIKNMTKQKKSFLDRIISSREKDREVEVGRDESKEIEGEEIGADVASSVAPHKEESKAGEAKEALGEGRQKSEEQEWFNGEEDNSEEDGQLTIDVYQTKDLIVVKSIIGGVRSEDLDISVTSDMVTIKGVRKNTDNVDDDDYYYQECFWGSFSRSVILPCDIRTDKVEATMKNGILTIKLPKIEKDSSTKIEVKEE
jgi:HSP20 family protein